jgi:hypothetical protein
MRANHVSLEEQEIAVEMSASPVLAQSHWLVEVLLVEAPEQ